MKNDEQILNTIAAELGIAVDDFGELELLGSAAETRAQGRTALVTLAMAVAQLLPEGMARVRCEAASNCSATVLEARAPDGTLLQGIAADHAVVRAVGPEADVQYAEGVHWTRLQPGKLTLVTTPVGSFVIGARSDGERVAVAVNSRPAPDLSMAPLSVAPASLLAASSPPWLFAEVEQRCSLTGLTFPAVAAAALAQRHDPPVASGQLIQALLRGELPEPTGPQRWISSLPSQSLIDASDVAIGEVQQIEDELAQLSDEVDLGSEDWRATLANVCVRRDVLEGVRALFAFVGSAAPLDAALARFDADASAFARSLYRPLRLNHPILAAAADIDPTAWWTQWSVRR